MDSIKSGLLVLALLALLPLRAAADVPISVMTFNIRFGTAHDGPNNWPNRQDMTVRMLREYEPGLIGTQELLDFQADWIVRWLPGYRWFGAPRTASGLPERSAIMYQWQDFIVLESGTFWLSETPGVFGTQSWESSLPRIATWARFIHPESGRTFYFYNTHFDHRSQQAREEGMRVILRHIEANAGDGPVIFVGDFNAVAEQNKAYELAVEAGFEDVWLTAATREGPAATWNAFRELDPESDRRIDWILTRGAVAADHVETVTHGEGGRWVSDHFPVFARLRLLAPEE